MPDWRGSTRHETLPPGWSSTIAPRIMRRDHGRCQWIREDTGRRCLRRATGGVDHKIRPADGGTDHDSNLWALCGYHHGLKTGREGGAASAAARARRKADEKPLHPGLLRTAPDRTPPPF